MANDDLDVLIVGAGLSGMCAAYHVQTACPHKSYAVLESRERSGGTWDLFTYPGIRSDSDMYTLGYRFHPWSHGRPIAGGADILAYIREVAATYGIDEHIRYRHRVDRAEWSSDNARWTVTVSDALTAKQTTLTARFLFLCTGYYDYETGHAPTFSGQEQFGGQLVHPQHWPADLDYSGKRVVVIGSGATAVTLVPALAQRAAHVTMLQRSPSYVLSVPNRDLLAKVLQLMPAHWAHAVQRWKYVLLAQTFYQFCRRYPRRARRFLMREVEKRLGGALAVEPHFAPHYEPWDQRLCIVPDDDLFTAIRSGKASVATGHIERFTESGVVLQSGEHLAADIVVTATGLKLKIAGGIRIEVDGKAVEAANTLLYKGAMLSDVPNFALAVGYTNASWTLKCELAAEYVARLLATMDAQGYAVCCPRRDAGAGTGEPLIDLSAGYVQRAQDLLPRQGSAPPWRLYQSYLRDRRMLSSGPIEDGVLELRRAPELALHPRKVTPAGGP